MRRLPGDKDFALRPLAGHLDVRTPDGEVGFYNFRLAFNVDQSAEKKRRRLGGWRKHGHDSPIGFKNQDLHDQLLGCLFYHDTFERTVSGGGNTTGYAYAYWFPGSVGVNTFVPGDSQGPICGYAPEYYDVYEPIPQGGVRFICDAFTGYPYTTQPSNSGGGAPLSYSDFATATTTSGTTINWNRPHVLNGFDYLDAIEAEYGSHPNIDDARTFLGIYAAATNATTDPQGTFTGTVGTVNYTYTLEYDAESGGWITTYDFSAAGGGLSVLPICNSGPPDYYATSYFSLCYLYEYMGDATEAYGYGPATPITTAPYSRVEEYCGSEWLYLPSCQEVITFLAETVSVEGSRRFLAGTKSRLYMLNDVTGNWRVLADGLGGQWTELDNCECSQIKMRHAQLGNIVMFTNGVDPVLYWTHGTEPAGCAFWSADYVPDLVALNITAAGVIQSWEGFMFLADVTENGERHASRIYWSDFNAPLSFIPVSGSLAGFHDLGKGERVLAIEPMGGQLRVYTSRGDEKAIYLATLVGGDAVFTFNEIYRGTDGLEFRYSLVNTGKAHWWVGKDGIYTLGEYDRTPQRPEWLHKASAGIFAGIKSRWLDGFTDSLDAFGPLNWDACDHVIGFYDSNSKTVWFSWPTDNNDCPNMSLRFSTEYAGASFVDHGFTAGAMRRPDYTETVRDWLASEGFCNPFTDLLDKEGLPYGSVPPIDPPSYILNPTEDPDLPVVADSVCSYLGDDRIADLCRRCDGKSILVMASAEDKTLKQFEPEIYYRERYVDEGITLDCPYTTPGQYENDGYCSLLQRDAYDFQRREEKYVTDVDIEFDAEPQSSPSELHCQIGYSGQAGCLQWDTQQVRDLACLTDQDAADYATTNKRPDLTARYKWHRRGRWLAWRLYVCGTGGGASFDSVTEKIRLAQGEWK